MRRLSGKESILKFVRGGAYYENEAVGTENFRMTPKMVSEIPMFRMSADERVTHR